MSVATRTPTREVETLRERFDRLFSEMTAWPKMMTEPAIVPLDMRETETEFVVTASMPGFKPDEIVVDINRGVLTMRAETKEEHEEKDGTWHLRERRYGTVHRAITLLSPVYEDEVKAAYENGILTVTLPKSEQAKPRRIEVTGT